MNDSPVERHYQISTSFFLFLLVLHIFLPNSSLLVSFFSFSSMFSGVYDMHVPNFISFGCEEHDHGGVRLSKPPARRPSRGLPYAGSSLILMNPRFSELIRVLIFRFHAHLSRNNFNKTYIDLLYSY